MVLDGLVPQARGIRLRSVTFWGRRRTSTSTDSSTSWFRRHRGKMATSCLRPLLLLRRSANDLLQGSPLRNAPSLSFIWSLLYGRVSFKNPLPGTSEWLQPLAATGSRSAGARWPIRSLRRSSRSTQRCVPYVHGFQVLGRYVFARLRSPLTFSYDSIVSCSLRFRSPANGGPPSSVSVLNHLATIRPEPENEDDSTADQGAPPRGSGWAGKGRPMDTGTGYTWRRWAAGPWAKGLFPTTPSGQTWRTGTWVRREPVAFLRYSLRLPSGQLENAQSPLAVSQHQSKTSSRHRQRMDYTSVVRKMTEVTCP